MALFGYGMLGIERINFPWHHRSRFVPILTTTMSIPVAHFREIAEKLGTLSHELKSCTDPTKRLNSPRQFRTVFAEADYKCDFQRSVSAAQSSLQPLQQSAGASWGHDRND